MFAFPTPPREALGRSSPHCRHLSPAPQPQERPSLEWVASQELQPPVHCTPGLQPSTETASCCLACTVTCSSETSPKPTLLRAGFLSLSQRTSSVLPA